MTMVLVVATIMAWGLILLILAQRVWLDNKPLTSSKPAPKWQMPILDPEDHEWLLKHLALANYCPVGYTLSTYYDGTATLAKRQSAFFLPHLTSRPSPIVSELR